MTQTVGSFYRFSRFLGSRTQPNFASLEARQRRIGGQEFATYRELKVRMKGEENGECLDKGFRPDIDAMHGAGRENGLPDGDGPVSVRGRR